MHVRSDRSTVESLESRRLMSAVAMFRGGTLFINGDNHASNDILVRRVPDAGTIQVDVNSVDPATNQSVSTSKSFDQSTVKRVIIKGGHLGDSILVGRNDPDWHINVFIYGGKGNDDIATGGGDDWILGGDGNDHISSGAGNDRIFAGKGNDEVAGDNGNDWIQGDQGNDVIDGGEDNDILWGGQGDDTLTGDGGNDILRGGPGGHDAATGGAGSDTFIVRRKDDVFLQDYDAATDLLTGQSGKGGNGKGHDKEKDKGHDEKREAKRD
jgi:Ca2+-binding RTX toxin-like protein